MYFFGRKWWKWKTPTLKVVLSLCLNCGQLFLQKPAMLGTCFRGTQRQFLQNICSEDDLRSRIFGTFVVKFLACLPLLGFSNI